MIDRPYDHSAFAVAVAFALAVAVAFALAVAVASNSQLNKKAEQASKQGDSVCLLTLLLCLSAYPVSLLVRQWDAELGLRFQKCKLKALEISILQTQGP